MNNQKNKNVINSGVETLENYWNQQNIRINILEQYVENGGIISERVNDITSYFEKANSDSFSKFLDAQAKLLSHLSENSVIKSDIPAEIEFPFENNTSAAENPDADNNAVLSQIDINDSETIKRYEINLKRCEKSDYSESCLPEQGTVIVFGKKDKYVDALGRYLTLHGLKPYIISDIFDEAQAEGYISSIKSQISGLIIAANFHYKSGKDSGYYDFIMSSFYITKYFSKYVHDGNCKNTPLMLFTTFLDGNLGITGESEDYAYGSFNGIAKTLSIEFKETAHIKLIDFRPDTQPQRYIELIDDELKINDIYPEVGRTPDGMRFYPGADLTPYVPCKNMCNITPDDIIVVSGGSGGVTSECILELARAVKCTFVIIGRAEISNENSDDAGTSKISELKDMKTLIARRFKENGIKGSFADIERKAKAILAQRSIINILDNIEATGNNGIYYSCDVNNAEQTRDVMKRIHEEVGKVSGIIHGAGVVCDSKIWRKDTESFKKVFDTKYRGLNNLTDNVDNNSLKVLVMFSSIAAYFGSDGQIDYSAGNEYIDKYAYYYRRKHPQCRALAINWGAWDGGMVDDTYKKILAERGFILIPLKVGANYFKNDFIKGLPSTQIMISHSAKYQ